MKKFKLFCIKFALFVYTNYITEDRNYINKVGKIIIYPLWFIRSCFVWLICPIFLPEYLFKQSKIYKQIQKIQKSPEYQAQMMKSINFLKFN